MREVPSGTIKVILAEMGFTATASALRELKSRPWNRLVEPVTVVRESKQSAWFPLNFPLEKGLEPKVTVSATFTDYDGFSESHTLNGIRPAEEALIEGRRHVRVRLPSRFNRPIGYHRLDVTVDTPRETFKGSMRIIVAPDTCTQPPSRTWGVTLSLYSLQSESSLGTGDLGCLKKFAAIMAGDFDAGFIGLSPLHAAPNRVLEGISPYSPTSRIYRNPLYLDITNLPGGPRPVVDDNQLSELRETELIDYDRAAVLKGKALRAAFDGFGDAPVALHDEFKSYSESGGESLRLHALYMALAEHFRQERTGGENWLRWPAEYQNPHSPEVEAFAKAHERDIEFQMYLQWAIERQLKEASDAASAMPVGLYFDLAVGSAGGGSDTWVERDVFGMGLDTGAPPDDFSPMGQNWMFPPLMPMKLRETGYEMFIRTIRANLQNAGALRIDHALGLFRLFMIPKGSPASEGAFVRYPAEEVLSIIALESRLNNAVIVAEDLGLVTEEARSGLHTRGMLSYRLLYFERDWVSGAFLPPESYPSQALAAISTHDLPTLRGWLSARDIAYRQSLCMYKDAAELERALQAREADKARLLEAIAPYREAASRAGEPMLRHSHTHTGDEGICLSAHAMLASTPSIMVAVTLDDMLGATEQQNIPGTVHEHPNWRRKYPVLIEEFGAEGSRPRAAALSLARISADSGRAPAKKHS